MCSLYLAVKLRRFGVPVSSTVGAAGAATTRAGVTSGEMASGPASGESGVREGMTIGSFPCAPKCKLQPVECLTLIGTEGSAAGKALVALAIVARSNGVSMARSRRPVSMASRRALWTIW